MGTKGLARRAPMMALGMALAPMGAGEWRGDDGACELRVRYLHDGRVSAALHLPGRAEPVGFEPGALVTSQGGVVMSARPGNLDAALLGAGRGIAGTGVVGTVAFRARADGEWATAAAPKIKTNLVPTAIGSWGFAISGTATYDLTAQHNTALAITIPATLRLSNVVRINLNAGWQWDRVAEQHYATYGAGIDWRTPDNVWTLTAEVFGQLGARQDAIGVTEPRFQVGLRWRPIDEFNVDLIYGRNIYGENANWITLATVFRFNAGK